MRTRCKRIAEVCLETREMRFCAVNSVNSTASQREQGVLFHMAPDQKGNAEKTPMKTSLCLSFACLIAVVAVAEPRTWTFTENGKIKFQSGSMSFAKGGKIDAEFVRADMTNVFLKVINAGGGQDGSVPLTSLSEADLLYVEWVNAAPVDVARVEQDAQAREAQNQQHAQVVAKETAKRMAEEATSARQYMTMPKTFGSGGGNMPTDFFDGTIFGSAFGHRTADLSDKFDKNHLRIQNMIDATNKRLMEDLDERREMGRKKFAQDMLMQEGIIRAMRDDEEGREYARARREEELRILSAERALKEQQLEASKGEFEELQRNANQDRSTSTAEGSPSTVKQINTGSGFFATDDGYFLTCLHVVDKCEHIALTVKQGAFTAILVKADSVNDLALLKVSGSFRSLPLATGAVRSWAIQCSQSAFPTLKCKA